MRRINKYERMISEGRFNEAVVAKLQTKKFRAHVRRLVREAARMNRDEHDFTNNYYVSITLDKNNQFDVVIRSDVRDGRYFNDVEEYTIDCDMNDEKFEYRCKFDAEYIILRESEELDAAKKYLRKMIRK